jgi:hypothetical protein
MGVSALFLSTSIVAFLIAGYRGVLRSRGRRKPTEIPLIVIAVAFGLALVSLAPATQALESALAPSLGRLLSNVCTLIAAFGLLHLRLYVSHPPEQVPAKVRVRLITLLIAIGVMAVMFFASSPPTGRGIFTGLYRSQPTLAAYTLVYVSYLGSAVIDLGTLALRSVLGARAWLRLGMILVASGSVVAVGYLIEKVIGVVSELVTGSTAEAYCPSSVFATVTCTFAIGMPALAVLLVILGTTLPMVGPRLEHPIHDLWRRRSLRRLRPLWEILHEALPNLALATPDWPSSPSMPGEIAEQLYRRVITIRDGLLALQPYRDPSDTREHSDLADAAGLTGRRRAAAVEAADIRAALHRRSQDMVPGRYSVVVDTVTQHDLSSELRWLTQVSEALACDELRTAQESQ